MISTEAYHASIGRFYNRLRHFANAQNVVSVRSGIVYIILLSLLFSLLYLPILLHALFALFMLETIGVVFVNSVRFKHIDFSCHFLELSYRKYNLSFLRSSVGCPKKIKMFKETAKNCDFTKCCL